MFCIVNWPKTKANFKAEEWEGAHRADMPRFEVFRTVNPKSRFSARS
jgi:hypothetical protein